MNELLWMHIKEEERWFLIMIISLGLIEFSRLDKWKAVSGSSVGSGQVEILREAR